MTPAQMAALHARCFDGPERWSEAAFSRALADPGAICSHRDGGFVLGRHVLDEAELLTIAVPVGLRGSGIGAKLLAEFEEEARRKGALKAFLEVASDNAAARALYLRAGWRQTGLRRNYYGPGRDGLILSRDLGALPEI